MGGEVKKAAPAPEGGAVETACAVFQEAIDDFEADVADVMAEGSERADLWDREITVNIDALKTVMATALATREEAPAETGKYKVWVVYGDDHDYDTMSQWLVGVYETEAEAEAAAEADEKRYVLEGGSKGRPGYDISSTSLTLRAQPPAQEARDCGNGHQPGCDCDVAEEDVARSKPPAREDYSSLIAARCLALPGKLVDCPVCGAVDNERARQAREDAQPVAWMRLLAGQVTDLTCIEREGYLPLYFHPAPDALRVAVEALEAAREVLPVRSSRSRNVEARTKIDQALTALKAEQDSKS